MSQIITKLLYLFLSFPPPSNLFSHLRNFSSGFCGTTDAPGTLLYLPYDRGGLRCPNPLWYYWAAHMRMLFYFTEEEALLWREMEGHILSLPFPIYLFLANVKKLQKTTKKPLWLEIRLLFGIKSEITLG